MKRERERFVHWRRSPEELANLGDLGSVLEHAKAIVADGENETVIVLEIKKVITRAKAPVIVKDY